MPTRYIAAAVLIGCFIASGIQAAENSEQWVRVHHDSSDTGLAGGELRGQLSDYGSFQWGRLESGQIEDLRRSGLNLTVEHSPFELRLGGQSFDPLHTATPAEVRAADSGGEFYLIQFDGPIRAEWLRALRARGVELVQPLHPFSYVVWAQPAPMEAARSLPHMRWYGLMRNEWKLPPAQRFPESEILPTMALASARVDPDRLTEQLSRFGQVRKITPLDRHLSVVHMFADGRDYPSVVGIPGILTVQRIPPETDLRGEMSNQSIVGAIDGSGIIQPGYQMWLNDTGRDGSGITVSVVDGPILSTHQDLSDRIVPCAGTNGSCDGTGSNAHGTHVAGAIAGTGSTGAVLEGHLRGKGVAPSANIVSQVYQPFLDFDYPGSMVPDGMLLIFQDSVRSGALLTNNSWGPASSPRGYDIPTRQVDMITRDADPDTPGNQPLLPVWSIMNGGGDAGGDCAPASLGSPDEAKNLFAVGSTTLQYGSGQQRPDIYSVSANSAHGPACDGRLVPHIVAPGCNTDSTVNSSDTGHSVGFCGTSMASPVVSGSVAVWAEEHIATTGSDPSPALAKAVFTAVARNLQGGTNADDVVMGHRPDRYQGYGRIDLDAVMNPGIGVFLFDQEHVFNDTGQHWSAEVLPDDPAEPVRIMLAWTDAPGHGLGGQTPAWINNLDLQVDTGGYLYLGNTIGPDGWSAAGGVADQKNNLEGVFLDSAQHDGVTTIRVMAAELKGDALDPYDPGDPRQDFALACYNCETYTIKADIASLDACIPPSGNVDHQIALDLGSVGDYSGNVALDSTGIPAGVSDSFLPSSVTVPDTSTWTLTISDAATPGSSVISIDGDDGSLNNATTLTLNLNSELAAVTLQNPAQGENVETPYPTFEWDELADAEEYRIQIAGDSGFNDILIDEVLASTVFTPSSSLDFGGTYYWRVQGINSCDGGDWSAARNFTTRLFRDSFEQADNF